MRKLGFKQQRVFELAKKHGDLRFEEVKNFYSFDAQARSCIRTLELLGYIKQVSPGFWKYIKKEKEE